MSRVNFLREFACVLWLICSSPLISMKERFLRSRRGCPIPVGDDHPFFPQENHDDVVLSLS